MLQNLFIGAGPKTRVIFDNAGEQITWGKVVEEVDLLTAKLSVTPHKRWALCYQNGYLFTIALLAVLRVHGQPVLLPNNCPGTLELFRSEFDAVLSDAALPLNFTAEPQNSVTDNPSIIFYTSGSTGMPKKVARSLTQITREIAILENAFGNLVTNAPVFSTVSHQHLYGLIFSLLWPLTVGRVIHLPLLTSPLSIATLITQNSPVTIITSPAMLTRMSPCATANRGMTIFSSGGKLKSVALSGCNIMDIFGSTETGGVAFRAHTDASWTPLPEVKVTIDRVTRCLQVLSPYCCDADLVMGDYATLNVDGSFQLLDRADRVVKVEGKRISLIEIENALLQHEFVQIAYVIFFESLRQNLAAVIVLTTAGKSSLATNGKRFINQSLQNFLARYFDPVVLPKKFRYVDEIPVNSQGKYLLAEINQLFGNEKIC